MNNSISTDSSWDILLIGGHSTGGKSVDDIRLALQRATRPGEIDGLHFFRNPHAIRSAEPDDLVMQLVRIGEIVSDAIESVIAHHVVTHTPIIIEGDGILSRCF